MEEDHQSLKRRLNEMAAVVEAMRRQQAELQDEMERQAARHEEERKRWHEECRLMQEQRDQLLKQRAKPRIGGLVVSSRTIGGSKSGAAQGFLGNRPRQFGCLPETLKQKLLEVVREKRQHLASNLQRQREAVEADQAARALDTLSISDQPEQNASKPITPPPLCRFVLPSTPEKGSAECQIEDLVKRRRMQQQLSSVLHAQNCDSNRVDAVGNVVCGVPNCSVTGRVLEHMRTCTFVTRCPTHMCSLTREAMEHYKNCGMDGCEICQPAKRESMSTQEHLIRFMDTICKSLDEEEISVETPSVPRVVDPPAAPGAGLVSLHSHLKIPSYFPYIHPVKTGSFRVSNLWRDLPENSVDMKMEDSDAHE